MCSNTCGASWNGHWHGAGDGACDDGGQGAEYGACHYATDCADCGPRHALSPWWKEAGRHWDSAMAKDQEDTARALGRVNAFLADLTHRLGLFVGVILALWLLHGLQFAWRHRDVFLTDGARSLDQDQGPDATARGVGAAPVRVTDDDYCEYIGPNPHSRYGPPVYTGKRPFALTQLVPAMPPMVPMTEIMAKEAEIRELRQRAAALGVAVPPSEEMHRIILSHLEESVIGGAERRPAHELAEALLNLCAGGRRAGDRAAGGSGEEARRRSSGAAEGVSWDGSGGEERLAHAQAGSLISSGSRPLPPLPGHHSVAYTETLEPGHSAGPVGDAAVRVMDGLPPSTLRNARWPLVHPEPYTGEAAEGNTAAAPQEAAASSADAARAAADRRGRANRHVSFML